MPYNNFGSGSVNEDNTYESIGFDSDGTMTTVTSTGTNGKGSYAQLSASTSNAWAGFMLVYGPASAGGGRFLIDISIEGGTTNLVSNFYAEPNQTVAPLVTTFPLNIAASSDVRVRCQSSSNNASIEIGIVGVVRNSNSPPLFSTCTTLSSPDTSTTRASGTNITLVGSGSTTYSSIIDPTAAAYGAILAVVGQGSTAPATTQAARLTILTETSGGGSATSVFVGGQYILNSIAAAWKNPPYLIRKSFASGIRISGQILVNTPGSDVARIGLYGFS